MIHNEYCLEVYRVLHDAFAALIVIVITTRSCTNQPESTGNRASDELFHRVHNHYLQCHHVHRELL